MLSRRGLLPAVRMPHREFEYKYINTKRLHDLTKSSGDIALSDLIKLITVELLAHGISPTVLAEEFNIRQTASVRLHRHLDQVDRERPICGAR